MQDCMGPATSLDITAILLDRFGHAAFRPGQQEVCEHVADGRDALLVMPTGAGKSLCYQVPGLARGGTTLVISPLIALMEDQAARLVSHGMRVARIHSGLERDQARAACRAYLDGELDFLFIAPERLRVNGFPEMLARQPPALIAVDEAHCISQWGHDFRADYRTLGRHIAALRPAPVIALTATATPAVQQDICVQLGMVSAKRFVHGFRRHNLAIEIAETPKPQRPDKIRCLLQSQERRPAIVYTASRRDAESLALLLANDHPAAAYHAGLSAETRARVQQEFLAGKLEIIVATVAFGMGVDKANVRAVIHAALPATVESYYQEIGRAGRDGLPCRAILLHSFADVKTQEFFIEQDYPESNVLAQVHRRLSDQPLDIEDLRASLSAIEPESFTAATERLVAHGGAQMVNEWSLVRGAARWENSYASHVQHRREQLHKLTVFTGAHGCRMAALIHHFGDTRDASRDCGICDWCAPQDSQTQVMRELEVREAEIVRDALALLAQREPMSSGKLQQEIPAAARLPRDQWDALLRAAARADVLFSEEATFTRAGETIRYRNISRTASAACMPPHAGLPAMYVPDSGREVREAHSVRNRWDELESKLTETKRVLSNPAGKNKQSLSAEERSAKRDRTQQRKTAREESRRTMSEAARAVEAALREWRVEKSRELQVPAFFVLSDQLLLNVSAAAPRTLPELRRIPGIGPDKLNRFGEDICRICATL